ncbi:MAG: LysM peptidoglycan-binding domain-containing M23 family metallopeptidase [Desulfomonilaceae bacterium]|nr:LysM peptidoglycan-binding domain-containing M23 family metallopeptidase [Desulfomonilaceae bacterium]
MGRDLKWLAVFFLPFFAACSSTAGLVKKDSGSEPAVKEVRLASNQELIAPSEEEGAFHIVGKGDSLRHICEVYGLDFGKVASINRLKAPYALNEGDTVFLPASALLPEGKPSNRLHREESTSWASAGGDRRKIANAIRGRIDQSVPEMEFPVPGGVLTSPFGYRWGKFHTGLDIAAPTGTTVRACADGRVIFTGSRKRFRRYGNTVLIHHGKGVYTYYAHLDKILVKKNQTVRKGRKIATVGNTGRSTGPHLHVEMRVGNKMYNPLAYFSPGALSGTRIAKRFTDSPMGPVRARWQIPDLLTARR